jgi:hypothetical protein
MSRAGFTGNFAVGGLQLGLPGGPRGQVRLVDVFDNQPTWAGKEATYLGNLEILPGSQMDVSKSALFCDSLEIVDATLKGEGFLGILGRAHASVTDGLVAMTGKVEIGAGTSLTLEVSGSPGAWGDASRRIIAAAGGVTGRFAHEPAPDTYLGNGVFLQKIVYGPAHVDVAVRRAAPGDTFSSKTDVPLPDLEINADDIQRILGEARFNSGTPADWSQGDFNDDRLCTADDIQLILATGLFNRGLYAAGAANQDGAGRNSDPPQATLRITPAGLLIDTQGTTVNGYLLRSAAGVFTGDPAENLGLLQEDADRQISGQLYFSLSGTHLLGDVIGAEWRGSDLAHDLAMTYTIEGKAGIYAASIVAPEPGIVVMLAGAAVVVVMAARVRRRRQP